MRYYDWLLDNEQNPKIVLFNVWIKKHYVSSPLLFMDSMLKVPSIELFNKEGESVCTIQIPLPLQTLPLDTAIVNETRFRYAKKEKDKSDRILQLVRSGQRISRD